MPFTPPELPCTWAEFKAWVLAGLDVDADRLNYEDRLDADVRYALLEIQQHVERYQRGHEAVYQPGDLTVQGSASIGALPFGAIPTGLTVVRTKAAETEDGEDACHSYPATIRPYREIDAFVAGCLPVNENRPLWANSRKDGLFYVFPQIKEEDDAGFAHKAILKFSAIRNSYADGDTVPYDEMVKEAVIEYVKAKVALTVEKNPQLYNARMEAYRRVKRNLYVQ